MRTVTLKSVVLGAGPPKVVVPLVAADLDTLLVRAGDLAGRELDVVEWRVDHFADAEDPDGVVAAGRRIAAALAGKPVLVTFRTAAEGGERAIDDDAYADLVLRVAESGVADAVDVELARGEARVRRVVQAAHAVEVPVVVSSHDFGGTPAREEIVARLCRMQELGADITKLAATPRDAGDVLTLLAATWTMYREHADRPLITMAMGGTGVVSRLAGEVFGSAATFGMVGQPSAPGQVELGELQQALGLVHRAL